MPAKRRSRSRRRRRRAGSALGLPDGPACPVRVAGL
ncbi:MAG: 50S ribosomal protein L32, partial [Planctomycetaceae bacterium]|nr:50S ribosomal protein L32 [Planctomycetaceae bacterium]